MAIQIIRVCYWYVWSLRPLQRIKNIIICLPLIFAGRSADVSAWISIIGIIGIACLLIGNTYIINDFVDVSSDRLHPQKRFRPIAAWLIHPIVALCVSWISIVLCLVLWYVWYGSIVWLFLLLYLINTLLYSFLFKYLVLIDVMSISTWFVIRWLLWVFVIQEYLSPWLLLVLFFWAMQIALLKRYQEILLWTSTRSVLNDYSKIYIQQMLSMVSTIVLVIYVMYSFNSNHSLWMIMTVPLVVFAMMRFYYHILVSSDHSRSIEHIVLTDVQLRIVWCIYLCLVIYIV